MTTARLSASLMRSLREIESIVTGLLLGMSMVRVTPPAAAAAVPLKKSSL